MVYVCFNGLFPSYPGCWFPLGFFFICSKGESSGINGTGIYGPDDFPVTRSAASEHTEGNTKSGLVLSLSTTRLVTQEVIAAVMKWWWWCNCHMQWTAEGSVFGAVSLCFFVCVWNISGTTERICAKFTRNSCLVPHSGEFEGQRSRSPGTKKCIFWPFRWSVCGFCLVKHLSL